MSTGLLEQRAKYPNSGYEYGYGRSGLSDADGNGRKEVDCSHLLNLMLKDAGYNIPYRSTSQLATDTVHFDFIAAADAQPGDIALWTSMGHTGVVESFAEPRIKGTFFGSQTSTGPKSARFGAGSGYWPMPNKYLRPKPEFRTGAQATPAAAPAAAPPKSGATILNFEYPVRRAGGQPFNDAAELFALLEKEPSGHYLLGANSFWHGGVHFSDASVPQCVKQEPIRCIADGEVVAYRLNKDYLSSEFSGEGACISLSYSNSFCLIRHEYQSPENAESGANKSKRNKLTFYSLYMHLLPYERYPITDEKVEQRLRVINGGWPARTLPMDDPASETVGTINTGVEFQILEEKDSANGTYRFARGRILKGKVGSKKVGDEVWFASQQNGQPISNGAGKQRLQDIPPPERAHPGYWQGKVRATVVTPAGVKVRSAPAGDVAGAQVAPNQILCPGSVVEFDSGQVRWLQLEDGKKHPLAECTFVPGQGGLKGEGSLPSTFWICVQDTGKGKMISRSAIIPSQFDSVVNLNTAIKVGDPVGYLGLYETPTAAGGKNSRHQVHIEIFSSDAQVQPFLRNEAGLRLGRKFLQLAAGAQLTPRSVLEQAAPSTPAAPTVTTAQEHILALDALKTAKDKKDGVWLEVNVQENGQTLSGLVRQPATGSAQVICQYDWEKLGFKVVEEANSNADGFLDPDAMPAFFRSLYNDIDKRGDGDGDGTVTPAELKAALKDKELRDRWSRLVGRHPSEWQHKSGHAKWAGLDTKLKLPPALLKHEKERIDHLVFWDELSPQLEGTVHHFHPIAFIGNFKQRKRGWAHSAFADLLGKVESKNDYTAYNRTTPKPLKSFYNTDLTTLTLKEVQEKHANRDFFAIGRYQVIPDTLNGAIKHLNLDLSLKFDEAIQDQIFEEYLIKVKRKAFINFLEGDGSVEDAIYAWAMEFASAGVRKGKRISPIAQRDEDGNLVKDENGKKIMIERTASVEGESYYSGDGLNAAHILPDEMVKVLEESKRNGI